MAKVYMYVVARDFGFAPNPFHGVCSLATCKPVIRRTAQVGDWVIGMGGSKLNAVGCCIFAMRVTEALTFDQYWSHPDFQDKRPVRNGSRKMMVGDNIYYHDADGKWQQVDSHHSQPDGTPDVYNLEHDTRTDRVLLSHEFFYFGGRAPPVPPDILTEIGFVNRIGHRTYDISECQNLLGWLDRTFAGQRNHISGDPFQFMQSGARYSVRTDRIT